jgi:hypothetical protein
MAEAAAATIAAGPTRSAGDDEAGFQRALLSDPIDLSTSRISRKAGVPLTMPKA